jgi:hypothetical protein
MKSVVHRQHGRPEAYTQIGVRRLPCFRCGDRAEYQWNVCADGLHHPVCTRCDIQLNALVLHWMLHPHAEQLVEEYARSKGYVISGYRSWPSAVQFHAVAEPW